LHVPSTSAIPADLAADPGRARVSARGGGDCVEQITVSLLDSLTELLAGKTRDLPASCVRNDRLSNRVMGAAAPARRRR
jgi:hypothetical protein